MEWPVAPVMNDPPTQHRPFQQEVDLGACDSGSRGHWMLSVELQISGDLVSGIWTGQRVSLLHNVWSLSWDN